MLSRMLKAFGLALASAMAGAVANGILTSQLLIGRVDALEGNFRRLEDKLDRALDRRNSAEVPAPAGPRPGPALATGATIAPPAACTVQPDPGKTPLEALLKPASPGDAGFDWPDWSGGSGTVAPPRPLHRCSSPRSSGVRRGNSPGGAAEGRG